MPHVHGSAAAANRGRLVAVLLLSLAILVVEVVGATAANSLALLADAGHKLTDVAGVGLAAGANATLLFLVAAYVLLGLVGGRSDPE